MESQAREPGRRRRRAPWTFGEKALIRKRRPSETVPRVIDISQEVGSGMRLFPVFPKPQFVQLTKRETYGFETEALFLATHTGTHVDSPFPTRAVAVVD